MTFRFAAVISHPIQHYAPIFRELGKVPGMQVKVFYGCQWGVRQTHDPDFGCTFAWDVPLLEGYDYQFLPLRREPDKLGFWDVDNPEIARCLSEYSPHAMWVHGYGHRTCWRAVSWAQRRCAVLHFGDSELLRPRSLVRRVAKHLVLRYFFRRCDAFITIGDNNEAYYARYGVPGSKMFRGACPIDLQRFRQTLAAPDRPSRGEMRARFGLPADAVVAVFSGKMVPIKRPGDLVEAVGRLRDRGVGLHALFVGDGPLRSELEAQVRACRLENEIRFSGFVNQRDIPLVLEAGDLLAIPSERDAHPLAVAESMAVGHPIVASDRVGCVGATDSARPGVNALVYPMGDTRALAKALEQLVRDGELRRRMGQASLELVAGQDVSAAVGAVLRAVGALHHRYKQPWNEVPEAFFRGLDEKRLAAWEIGCTRPWKSFSGPL